MIAQIPAGLKTPKAFGVAEMERLPRYVLRASVEPPRTNIKKTTSEVSVGRKICLAKYYSSVIMRGIYDKNVTFLWNSPAMVSSVNRMYIFDISHRYSFGLRARSNIKRGAANCRHGRRSPECLRRPSGTLAQPFFQHHASLRFAAVGIFLWRAF
jgi:hypothetical protein